MSLDWCNKKKERKSAKEGKDRVITGLYAVFGTVTRSQDTFNGRYNNDRHRERRRKSTYLDLVMSKGDVSLRKPGCAKMAAEKCALVSVSRVARAPSAGCSRDIREIRRSDGR